VEIERGLGLVDQGGDVADVDRLVQVDKLARLPQRSRNWRKFSSFRSLRHAAGASAMRRRRPVPSQTGRAELISASEETVTGKTMKALVLRSTATLDDLQVVGDYPMPQAIEGHVVIRVRASSFNYHDVFTVKACPASRCRCR
jgi:hypothetical protein